MADTFTDPFFDSFDGGVVTAPQPVWQFVSGNKVTLLYPYAKSSDGTLIPLFVRSVGVDTGTSLTVTIGDLGTATLTWTLVSGSTGYLVARDGGDGETITAGQGATSYTFTGLVNAQQYTLSVRPLPTGRLVDIVVTAVNTSTPPPDPGLGFGYSPFGTAPFGV